MSTQSGAAGLTRPSTTIGAEPTRSGAVFARMGQNILWLLGGRGFQAAASLIYLGLAARTLGVQGFGAFALVLAYGQAIANVAQFQSWQTVIRYGTIHQASGDGSRLGRLLGFTTMLDLGANVDCTAEHLLQFAVMGSALVSALEGTAEPSVGLLNIGAEAIKGSETIKQAGELLRAAANAGQLNYYGNVEGNDIFNGTVDIVVCDGFVGNVALKTSEGLAHMLTGFLRAESWRGSAGPLRKNRGIVVKRRA